MTKAATTAVMSATAVPRGTENELDPLALEACEQQESKNSSDNLLVNAVMPGQGGDINGGDSEMGTIFNIG
jgi:hypothetical protein